MNALLSIRALTMAAVLGLGVTACLPTSSPVGVDRPVDGDAGAAAGASGSAGSAATAGMSGRAGEGATAGASGSTAGMSGGAGGFQPGCHIDCFRGGTCQNGIVTPWLQASLPCGSGAQCPTGQPMACKKGCSSNPTASGRCPSALCRENAPKAVGDPCEVDDDCRPTVARVVGGVAKNLYLACDTTAGTCVARAAPGCTERCRSDDECPDGSTCDGGPCDPFDSVTLPGTCWILNGLPVTCPR